ncbi:hypothetical protein POHY109586_24470 [Polaromonas hydrogenivorans]
MKDKKSKKDVSKAMVQSWLLPILWIYAVKSCRRCERPGQSQRAVAEFFGVSLSFVEGLLRRVRRSGELAPPRQRPGPHARIDPTGCQRLAHWLQEQPDLTLVELAEHLQTDGRPAVSTPTLCRALQRLGLRRKKRPYTPQSATQRRYVRLAASTGRALPGMPPRG